MNYIINQVIQAIKCYENKDEIGCAIHLQNGGSLATNLFLNYLKYKDFI